MQPQRPQSHRRARVQELLRREIAYILRREMANPRLHNLTLTFVQLSRDQKEAKVGVSLMSSDASEFFSPEPKKIQEIKADLKSASFFVLELLRKRLPIRAVPKIRFVYDDSIQKASDLWFQMNQWEVEPSNELRKEGS